MKSTQLLREKKAGAFSSGWHRKITIAVMVLLQATFFINAQAQQKRISGTITNEKGEAISGATIMIKGTSRGVSATDAGSFSISASSGEVLIVTSLNYQTKEIPVTAATTYNITLAGQGGENLEQVIVVGYGTQRKEAVTGSVASVKGDIVREVPAANISQALQGRVAGVQMTQTSSKPGSTMQIRIRGTRSINAENDPLIVLDGIPFLGSIADIGTDDIKSIDILKDASATAIYGSRGANGVILITTNKGNKGQKGQVSYNSFFGVKDVIKYPMMETPEYLALRRRAGLNKTPGLDEDTTGAVNTDWQDLFYRTAIIQSHDLAITGGSAKGSYKFGINYFRDEAPLPGSQYDRFTIRGGLDQEVGSHFRMGFTTNNNYSITDGASLGMYGVLSMSPLANPFNTDGTTKRVVSMPQDNQWVYTKNTVQSLGDKWIDRTKAFSSYNSVFAELKIPGVEGLKARVNVGGNIRTSNSGSYTGIGVFSSDVSNPNTATVGNALTTQWTVENLLTYDRTFAQKHKINAVALYSAEQTRFNSSSISRRNIAGDNFQYFNLGQTPTGNNDDITINPDNQGYWESGLMSAMGRFMYSYDNRYMLSATFRTDASSRLAPGHKWNSYPAISAGWNIQKESFMQKINWVDALKLRVGYGQTSNQAVAPYATLGTLSTRPYNFGAINAIGNYVSMLPNSALGWEYSKTKNLGVDFGFFNSRITGSVEYYVTDTKDLLLGVTLPSTSGVSSYTGNVGATQNKGWELALNGVILDNKNGWTWEAGVNFYKNRNKVVALASGQSRDDANWLFVGHPLNVIYDFERVGIWQTSEAEAVKKFEGSAGKPGMIKVKYAGSYDANGSPTRIIGSDDRQILNADPNFMGGFNTRVAYKGIDLSIVGTYQNGGILNSTLYGSNGYLNLEDGRRGQIKIDYWTEENPGARFPDPNGPKNSNNPKYGSTLGYFSGSFMKIRTISLGYNLNYQWMKRIGMERMRIYFTAQNPFVLFSPYHKQSGMDPETNSYANDAANMAVPYEYGQRRLLTVGYNTPVTRNYLVGLNVTF